MELSKLISDTGRQMDEAIARFQDELKTINTGRASSLLVEGIVVSYYGSQTPLKQVATITTPDANQIVITPWDKNALGDIESAIRNSDIGLSPTNDGNSVRLSLPPMTEERRIDLKKMISKLAEEAKVSLRNHRGESWDKAKDAEKKSELTEDDRYQAEKELNNLITKKNQTVDEITQQKEAEIMKV